MSEWKEYKLGDIASFSYGKLPKHDLLGKGCYVTFSGYKYIERYPEYNCEKGDVILVARGVGGTGDVKLTTQRCFLTNLSIKLDLDNRIVLNDYFYNMFRQENLRYLDSGSAQSQITIQDLANVIIEVPSIDKQKRIAGVLSSLDDKIDLLHRENATLEALAETLFRHYFIENPNPDWKEGNIADVVDFNPARKLGKGENAPYVEMANVGTNGYAPSTWRIRPFQSGTKFINGDALMARISPCLENGKAAFVDFLEREQVGWGSTEFIVMRSKLGIHPFFVYVLSKYDDFRDHAVSSLVGSSGRQRVDLDNLIKYPFIIPDKQAIELFNYELNTIFPKIQNNQKQIHTLTAQRDTLLSRLMNGEVNVVE